MTASISLKSGRNIKFWKYNTVDGLEEKNEFTEVHEKLIRYLYQYDNWRLLSCSLDRTIKIWNLKSMKSKPIGVLRGHHGSVSIVQKIPKTEDIVVSGSEDATIRLWDLKCQKEIHKIKEHSRWVGAILFLDENNMVTGADDGEIILWDMNKLVKIRQVTASDTPYGFINCLRMLPDGRFASCSFDGKIQVWNKKLRRGEILQTSPVWRFEISSKNNFYVAPAETQYSYSFLECHRLEVEDLLNDFRFTNQIFKRYDPMGLDNMSFIRSLSLLENTGGGLDENVLFFGTETGAIGVIKEKEDGGKLEVVKDQQYPFAHCKKKGLRGNKNKEGGAIYSITPLVGTFDRGKYLEMRKDLVERKNYLVKVCPNFVILFRNEQKVLVASQILFI